nr:HEPN domain-containing protein [uncultured Sphingomonas sp.]
MTRPDVSVLAPALLKDKQRKLRDGFSTALTLRVHRALSWFTRAMSEQDDQDVRFILLWIGFNAAYASEIEEDLGGDRSRFNLFFRTLLEMDSEDRIYTTVWNRFSNEIRLLLDNSYVFAPFWAHHNGIAGNSDWADRLQASRRRINRAMADHDTATILSILFDRLYVLRNQLVHGGATWQSRINRDQVRDGAALLAQLLPIFIDLMMDHPDHPWGMPFYPVVD